MKRSPALSLVVTLAVATAVAGCTSFAFKQGGRGSAPSELQDRDDMVEVAAGSFEMGWKTGEPDEFPAHKVSVSSFVMDKTEVTIGAFNRCVEARVCKPVTMPGEVWPVTDTHPVVAVTWFEARKYCEWVGKRLPTEAEWEYAARRPRFVLYPWDGPWAKGMANARDDDDGFARTAPVGSFPKGRTANGIEDLAGNASEWTADWYESTWYQKSPDKNPTGPELPTGQRVVRGGSWSDPSHLLRSVTRIGLDPNVSNDAVGFRCAADH